MADQMIFKRCEIKYMLDITQAELLKNQMKQYMTADEHGVSTICSLYFDTPDYLLIQRSMEHPVYKEKLRLRSYGTADKDTTVFVELKKKYESVVYKRRIAMTEDEAERYLLFHEKVKDTQITREIDYCLKNYKKLAPAVMLSYEREAFYAKDDHEFRITFDQNILWRNYDLSLCKGIYGEAILDKNKVPYEVLQYECDEFIDGLHTAEKTGAPVEQSFKTLIVQGKSKEYYVVVIPIALEIDLKKAAKAVGEKSVELIHVKDITKVSGYVRGGCSPLGMKKQYPTIIHESALEYEQIYVSGGRIGTTLKVNPKELAEVVSGKFVEIATRLLH